MNTLNNIFQKLGLINDEDNSLRNGLYLTNDIKWKSELQFPNRIVRLLENNIKPDAFFCIDNKPLILFFENPTDNNLHKKIWNFNETPIVIIVKNDDVEIFNGFKYEKDLNSLAKIGNVDKLNDFTYFKLFTDKTWEDHKDDFKYENRLDYFLLKNIKSARNILKKQIAPKIANALIGKCIFVCYLIDREVSLNFDGVKKKWNKDRSEFCELLKSVADTKRFFDYLKVKFNGDDIFALSNSDFESVTTNELKELIKLLNGDDLEQGQPSLFNFYDFSIIPIEFISNVYELFIGKENQEEKGAYYTPLFLVDYILKETVEKHFKNNKTANGCITLDPACGSGIFLVETLRKIIEQYQRNNRDKKLTPDILKQLAVENIYGIDDDYNAIQVAMFSIYLTLLDYQTPADIETFQFTKLENTNFFKADFFNTDPNLFETKLKNINFDYIIGNPPWKGGALGKYGKAYINERREKDKAKNKKYLAGVNNGEIVEGFVLRVSDFSTDGTKCAFIVRSTILYNRGYNSEYNIFRRYWLEEFFVNKIVELAPVRREIFDNRDNVAIAPAAILFYQYADGKNTNDNVLEHITIKPTRFFSNFKIFTINRPDYKKVEQKLLKDNDWLFKTLVYGSYMDFNLIRRLKENYTSIKTLISNSDKFISETGVQYSKTPTYDATKFHTYPFVDAYAIEPYFVNPDKIGQFTVEKVHRIRNEQIFKAPMLLIRKGPDTKLLISKSAICEKDAIYKDTLTAIKVFLKSDIKYLKNIEAILHSNIYTYFSINTFASIGIEREQIQNYDKFSVPYIENDDIINWVETIEKATIELHNLQKQNVVDNIKCSKIKKTIDDSQKIINEPILQALNFNEIEKSLLDYALNINRPLITLPKNKKDKYEILGKLQKPQKNRSKEIIEYANVYLNRFKRNMDNDEQKFIVRVWHTNQLLGMFFEVVPTDTQEENGIIWENATDKQILSLLIALSSEKITDRLFVQKDVRGFEKERFYIFKPNEKRLWHKAIAYLDAEEFMDAILKAGRRGE